MMRSLWSGVSGLNTHLLEMDVIGNNISNVNTTSFKSQATGFKDILYQTVKNTGIGDANRANTNMSQVGLGAKVGSIYTNITSQGQAITTNNAFDLMITGDSFFCISPNQTNQVVNYTRDGSFTIDADGNLVTQGNGYYVMGIMGDGEIGNAIESPLALINDSTMTMAGSSTTAAYYKGNIDKDDSSLKEGKTLQLEVYGTDGNTYTLKFKLTDGGDDADNTFNMSLDRILDSDGKRCSFTNEVSIDLVYNKANGELVSANGNTDGQYVLNVVGDAALGTINLDLSHTTNYASHMSGHSSTIYGYKGDTEGMNQGYPEGTMTNLSVTDNGSIYARYSNGQEIKIAQIAVAQFNNAMGLEKVGDNLYAASPNSGAAMYMDVTADGGYISAGVLEGSNVDLAKEFTDMITTQRGFQANSKVITTSDELLQVLRGLKR
ncbi:MAG: flagellar hook-basal body complex protein [Butyrivibrio sp.]|nr:flagellar hook-basal body complex protein [Butyrivibrio sp.]